MKFPFYTNLNDNFSASNCRDISKQRARALPPPSRAKFPKSAVEIGLKREWNTSFASFCAKFFS